MGSILIWESAEEKMLLTGMLGENTRLSLISDTFPPSDEHVLLSRLVHRLPGTSKAIPHSIRVKFF